ncbi:MAG: hypothetical protein V7636_2026, partial [Actinomycetota bacterium]
DVDDHSCVVDVELVLLDDRGVVDAHDGAPLSGDSRQVDHDDDGSRARRAVVADPAGR